MDYKATLNLPKTSFPMKADLPKREPETLTRWDAERLYEQVQAARRDAPRFLLHDGPPYANGDIHIGHALNKILKDIILRYRTLRGRATPYVPGWDCHGMPIEHALFKELGKTKHQIPQSDFRKQAKAYAQRYIGIQREQFKRLGVLGEWDAPYLTMAPEFEAAQLRAFAKLVEQGLIERQLKPVYWCATCETALAEAEVEYEDRQDTSIFVKLPLSTESFKEMFNGSRALPGITEASFVIWTTTPWTLPANVAVALHPEQSYRVVQIGKAGWIVADQLASAVLKNTGQAGPALCQIRGQDVAALQTRYARPFASAFGRVVTDEFVSMEDGSGIVHIAPGHGEEDYKIGVRNKLEVLSPVDERGRFTADMPAFAGQSVFEANANIIADLKSRGLLLKEEPITHSYPHCWRCKQPVIFRATPQWFLRVDGLRDTLLHAVKGVKWTPSAGESRMRGMLETRPDWCLSRQRYWGVPIPVVYCAGCQKPLLETSFINQVAEQVARAGSDWWVDTPVEQMPGLAPRACACGQRRWTKSQDIFDVWFDSGVSHEAVLRPRGWHPAHLYLEGSDQHRGWFQVSLITGVALNGRAPYEGVLTHGFVVDGEGRKMSKSSGNVISPQTVIERYGADILRLWVAASDYREDVRISDAILEQMAETYRKLRNTFRYLLANLADFQPARDAQSFETLGELDRWALHRTQDVLDEVTAAYDASQFHQVVRMLSQYCVVDLSAFYLDAVKDRLYTEAARAPKRRCAQTTLYGILGALVRLVSPILTLTAEEIWQAMRASHLATEASVHLAQWPAPLTGRDDQFAERWARFLALREVVMKALEEQRMSQRIGSPLDARVTVTPADQATAALLAAHRETLAEAFVVSEIVIAPIDQRPEYAGEFVVQGVGRVRVERAADAKCQRCWKHLSSVGRVVAHPQLCARCADVVMTAIGTQT